MKSQVLSRFMMTTLLAGAGLAATSTSTPAGPVSDADVARQVMHQIRNYAYYSVWDDVGFRVNNGQVELSGAVNQPFKKSDIERMVKRVPGVTGVTDEIKVLPLSTVDDRIRMEVAHAIFGDPSLSRYGLEPTPSIHIIVDGGQVTLTGFVESDFDKNVAGMRAAASGLNFGVTNNLQVENPSKKG